MLLLLLLPEAQGMALEMAVHPHLIVPVLVAAVVK
jgi:hypothetical protein